MAEKMEEYAALIGELRDIFEVLDKTVWTGDALALSNGSLVKRGLVLIERHGPRPHPPKGDSE